MKHLKLIYLIIILGLIGCSNDEPIGNLWDWDCPRYIVFIDIQDTDGNDLFSEDYNGIVSLDDVTPEITYTYNGETKPVIYVEDISDYYEFDWGPVFKSPASRDIPAPFIGMYVHKGYFPDQHPQICFGEFKGTKAHNESVTLNWPDGTHSKIEFTARAVKFEGPYHLIKTRIDDGEWIEKDDNVAFITFVK